MGRIEVVGMGWTFLLLLLLLDWWDRCRFGLCVIWEKNKICVWRRIFTCICPTGSKKHDSTLERNLRGDGWTAIGSSRAPFKYFPFSQISELSIISLDNDFQKRLIPFDEARARFVNTFLGPNSWMMPNLDGDDNWHFKLQRIPPDRVPSRNTLKKRRRIIVFPRSSALSELNWSTKGFTECGKTNTLPVKRKTHPRQNYSNWACKPIR